MQEMTVSELREASSLINNHMNDQAREIMNSIIGTVGLAVIERFVEKMARENILPKIADVMAEMDFDEIKDATGQLAKK